MVSGINISTSPVTSSMLQFIVVLRSPSLCLLISCWIYITRFILSYILLSNSLLVEFTKRSLSWDENTEVFFAVAVPSLTFLALRGQLCMPSIYLGVNCLRIFLMGIIIYRGGDACPPVLPSSNCFMPGLLQSFLTSRERHHSSFRRPHFSHC